MKNLMHPLGKKLMLFCTLLLLLSCDLNSGLDEIRAPRLEKSPDVAAFKPGPVLSFPISLNRVDLFTVASTSLSGVVTVQIRNADGTVILGSTTVSGSSIIKGNSVKNTFWFYPALTLNSGEKYRIYLTRSNVHNASSDYLYWRTCSGGVDGYPKGVMNYSPAWLLDYSFVTYSDGYADQQQTSTNYGFAVSNTSYLWQEFVPSKIWVIGS